MSIADLIAGKRPGLGVVPRTVATVASVAKGKPPKHHPKPPTVATVASVAVGESTKTTLQEPIYHNNNKVTLSLSCARERKNAGEATATVATPATHRPPSLALSESESGEVATATVATPATVPTTGEAAGPPRAARPCRQ